MDLQHLLEEFRKLEKDAGKEASSALLNIMELKMSDYKSYIDQRFTAIDERFSEIDQKFSTFDQRMTDKFASIEQRMTEKFASIEQRMTEKFTSIDQRFNSIQWFIGIGFSLLGVLIVLLKFL